MPSKRKEEPKKEATKIRQSAEQSSENATVDITPSDEVIPEAIIDSVNGSGVQQLRALMYTTPHEYVMMETNQLCARNPEFMKTNDWIYPLAYNNKPVFLSHDMDYFRIKKALKDWQSGQRFYISCYPEQVKYMSILFPGAEFL